MMDNFYYVISELNRLEKVLNKLPKSREKSLAMTKMDEAKMWLQQGIKNMEADAGQ